MKNSWEVNKGMIIPDMERIKIIALSLEDEIKALENKLENETCKNIIVELQSEIRAKGLTLFGYQRTLNSRKYS